MLTLVWAGSGFPNHRTFPKPQEKDPVKIVEIYLIRHGKRRAGVDNFSAPMVEEGEEQVADAARDYLSNKGVDVFLSSNVPRAVKTTQIAAREITGHEPHVHEEQALGFDGLPGHEYPAAMSVIEKKAQEGEVALVSDFIEWMPISAVRCRLGIMMVACLMALSGRSVAVAGSHGTFAELAALNPDTIPALGFAGIICYTVRVGEDIGSIEIMSSELIFEGF